MAAHADDEPAVGETSTSGSTAVPGRGRGGRPRQQLRIRLRPDAPVSGNTLGSNDAVGDASGEGGAATDLFSLSASLVADETSSQSSKGAGGAADDAAAGAAAQPRRELGIEEQRTLSKLVGCLTKEGKRSRAQRVVSDALHIIAAQLRKGGTAAAPGSSSGKGG